MIEEPGIPGLLRIVRNLELELRRLKGRVDAVLEGTNISGGTIIGTPPDTSNAGFIHYDADVDPEYLGVDGALWKLITGSTVRIYKTPQAMYDAYVLGTLPVSPGTRPVVRLNRNNGTPDLDMSAAAGPIYLYGEAQFAIDNLGGGPVVLGTVSIVDPDSGVVMENLNIVTELIASGANANDQGMLLQLTNVAIERLTGGIRGLSSATVAMRNVGILTEWVMTPTAQASVNVFARFEHVFVGGFWGDFGADAVIAGIYSFEGCTFHGGIVFTVGTDKHFVFTDCDFGQDLAFDMDGGTLTLEFYGCRYGGNNIIIADLGGGGTVSVIMNGGYEGGSPMIDSDATVVVTAVVDGLVMIGAEPHFRGQFVDSSFGGCSPPDYVVEFL